MKSLTLVIFHVHPHLLLLLAVSKGAVSSVVALSLLQNLCTHLTEEKINKYTQNCKSVHTN